MNRVEINVKSKTLRKASAFVGGLLFLLAAGCSSDNPSPTAATKPDLMMTSASIVVNDQSVNGQTLSRGESTGVSTRFEAQIATFGLPTAPVEMWLEYGRPQGSGLPRDTGRLRLYDDGMQGDLVAGDGRYSFEDLAGDYGFHSIVAPVGEYHYEFYGFHDDHETNHINTTVTIIDS